MFHVVHVGDWGNGVKCPITVVVCSVVDLFVGAKTTLEQREEGIQEVRLQQGLPHVSRCQRTQRRNAARDCCRLKRIFNIYELGDRLLDP